MEHHLGNGYFYFAHFDTVFSFTSSWAACDNINNLIDAQKVIADQNNRGKEEVNNNRY